MTDQYNDKGESGAAELLPCPFCGGTDLTVVDNDAGDYRQHWEMWVECCACDARSSQVKYLDGKESQVRLQAIFAWNTRVSTPQPNVDEGDR